MRVYNKSDFKESPFKTILPYNGYWLKTLRHTNGTLVDFLYDRADNPVEEPNNITDIIRDEFKYEDQTPKIIQILIEDKKHLVILMPKII